LEEGGLRERKPIREKECGHRIWTNREPSSRLQRGGWVRSKVREETALFRAHQRTTNHHLKSHLKL
jgi:hypothetical protein